MFLADYVKKGYDLATLNANVLYLLTWDREHAFPAQVAVTANEHKTRSFSGFEEMNPSYWP